MRNEERYIKLCLDSVLSNDYPHKLLEIIVIDGMSTDRSREIVHQYAQKHDFIRSIENPKRVQAPGLNLGIRASEGEIILCMNAHTTYASDYVRKCVTALETTGADNVSGVQHAVGTDFVSSTIAVAITTPFGIGDARFRYSNKEQWVDTVFPGAWYKHTLEELGGFNEEWVVNEDYELNYRLRKKGGKILLSPNIHCQYYVRSTLKALVRQYFRYGFWKVKTLVAHPDSLRWRHLMPPFFVMALLISLALMFFHWRLGIIIPVIYAVSCILASFRAAGRSVWKHFLLLPIIFLVLHLSWGVGFWAGVLNFGIPKFTFGMLFRAFRALRHP
jgi:cellulose synthase/poly-beta-1,6-N-acetylglucosamine synthase-like glycosyltransferase